MSAHILQIIERVKGEEVNNLNELGILTYYKAGIDLAQWGNLLDLRDLCYIEQAQTWEELLDVFTKMEPKYRELWKLSGMPEDFEAWYDKLPYWKTDSVGKEYWDTLNTEVDYGRPLGVVA
jgi:hypothetical protein